MSQIPLSIGLLLAVALPLPAQLAQRRPVVRASGEGVVVVRPDQVKVSVGVTNQARTAQEAAEENARVTNQVLEALRPVIGQAGESRTLGYSLTPIYSNVTPRVITGFQASNTIEVTLNNVALAGRVVDVAAGAGANQILGLRFTLRDPNPSRLQALRMATMQARANAEAIAAGLGYVGPIMIAEEGSRVTPAIDTRVSAGIMTAATTPIEPGNIDVRAYVAIEAEMIQ